MSRLNNEIAALMPKQTTAAAALSVTHRRGVSFSMCWREIVSAWRGASAEMLVGWRAHVASQPPTFATGKNVGSEVLRYYYSRALFITSLWCFAV